MLSVWAPRCGDPASGFATSDCRSPEAERTYEFFGAIDDGETDQSLLKCSGPACAVSDTVRAMHVKQCRFTILTPPLLPSPPPSPPGALCPDGRYISDDQRFFASAVTFVAVRTRVISATSKKTKSDVTFEQVQHGFWQVLKVGFEKI